MQQLMSRADEKVRQWAPLPACAAAILMILGATLTCGAATITPAGPAEVNGWPTFDQPADGSMDQAVIRARAPAPSGTGDNAPATVPLPPAVLTGGMILGMQWLAMGLTKNRKI